MDNTSSSRNEKIFIINRSEIEGRIDPNQYHYERILAIKKLKRNNKLLRLKDVVTNVKTVTNQNLDSNIYIGLENIVSNTGEYISTTHKTSISSAGIFKKGQILFPKLRPYLNKVHLAEFDGICSTEFHIFESDTFLNEFLALYLRLDLIVHQTKHLMTGNTLPRLQTEDINNLPVPDISIDTQKQIVNIYQAAYAKKQQKEAESKVLLEGIDSYLLENLGITLPQKDNSLKSHIFVTNFSETTGRRLDPDYISKIDFITKQNAKYTFTALKDLILSDPQYGANEEAIPKESENNIRYIRITDIDELGNLKPEGWKTARNTDERYLLNYNDLLFARSGSVGRCYIHKDVSKKAIFAGYLIRFILNTELVYPDYIFYFCNSSIYKFWVSAIERPAVQSNINSEEFKSLLIPLPSLEKQIEIANHIQEIRNRSKQLREEAKLLLEDVKKKVEYIILGE